MLKPLLLIMTQERKEHVALMLKNVYPTFDGVVSLVNLPSNDGTLELLEANKGNGRVLTQNWTCNHSFLMNHLLFYGGIKEGQWCLYLDSPESMTDKFIEILPNLINKLEENGMGSLFWDDRPYLFKYNSYMQFFGAVHWGIENMTGASVTGSDKDDYIINKRKETPEISWCLNPIKYWTCYPLGNETQIMYSKFGKDTLNKHENIRRKFRFYCANDLGLNLNNLNDLIAYMRKVKDKEVTPEDFFIECVETEYRLYELFQLKVLNMDFISEIVPRRFKFSFKDYLSGNSGYPENYKSLINQYEDSIRAT